MCRESVFLDNQVVLDVLAGRVVKAVQTKAPGWRPTGSGQSARHFSALR